jgi:hypothetical protein
MPKVVSNEQRLANRQNARHSTGPKTPTGKAHSSRNALKHGLLAKDVVINGPQLSEIQADFDALLADLVSELKPRTLIEETLVERIATCYWRLRRAQRFEVGAIRDALETPDPHAHALQKLRFKLASAEGALSLESELDHLLKIPEDQLTPGQRCEIETQADDFAQVNHFNFLGIEPPARMDLIRKSLPEIVNDLKRKISALREELETAERDESLRRARRPFISALPDRDALLKVVRYENMLDRQIHRALAELRRLRAVPHNDTTRKNCTRKTNPFETDT